MAPSTSAAAALALWLGGAFVPTVEAGSLRLSPVVLHVNDKVAQAGSLRSFGGASQGDDKAAASKADVVQLPEGAVVEVVNKTVPDRKKSQECLCPLGEFWHWRNRECVGQGAWGYECGFFPEEHWHRVCQDGLRCQTIDSRDNYHSHGQFRGTANARPASCVKCEAHDQCKVGEERHKDECMTELKLKGDACVTVKVSLPARESAINKELSHTATAKAKAKAKASATVTRHLNSSSGDKLSVNATASAKHTAEVKVSHTAREIVTTVTSVGPFVAQVTRCISVKDAKELLGISGIEGVSDVLSKEIIEVAHDGAQAMATRDALEEAKAAARAGTKDAVVTATKEIVDRLKAEAEARASEKAKEQAMTEAKKEAKAKAKEIAAALAKDKMAAAKKNAREQPSPQKEEPAAPKKEQPAAPATTAKPTTTTTMTTTTTAVQPTEPADEPLLSPPTEAMKEAAKAAQAAVADIASGGLQGFPLPEMTGPSTTPVTRKIPDGDNMP